MSAKMALFSYVPYLNRDSDTCGRILDLNDELLEKIKYEQSKAAHTRANGCAWAIDGDQLVAVLFIKDAQKLVNDMKIWSENQPQTFFRVIIGQSGDKYAVVIVPDLDMSLTRFRLSHQTITGNELELGDKDVSVIFTAVGFLSKPGAPMYAKMKDRIGKEIKIAFLDVEAEQFESSLMEQAIPLGTLKIEDTSYNGGYFSYYCNS